MAPATLYALDLATGRELWKTERNVFGTMLSYSVPHDVVLLSGRHSRDMIAGEPQEGLAAYRGGTGEHLWDYSEKYSGPCMIHGRTIFFGTLGPGDAGQAVDLLTGTPRMRSHPLTRKPVRWAYSRTYGCTHAIAGEHALFFRSGAAGFLDLTSGGTGNLGGFKSGCTANLIPADGVLNAPDYTRTCTCSYQNQTSLALVHDPDGELWTYPHLPNAGTNEPIVSLAINFGAPGDCWTAEDGLWLEHPIVGGPSPKLAVSVQGASGNEVATYSHHTALFENHPLRQIASSGLVGAETVRVALGSEAPRQWQVSLVFAEPERQEPARQFRVSIGGRVLEEDLVVATEAGGPRRTLVKTYDDITAGKELVIRLTPKTGRTILSGLRLRAVASEQ